MLKHFFSFLISITGTLTFAQGISVSPSRIFFDGKPGQTVSQSISFTNNSGSEYNFVATLKDWDRDSLGTKVYYPMGSIEASNAPNLVLSESVLQLNPGESKTVTVSLTIPQDASEVSHSMLFFTQVKEQRASDQASGLGVNVLLEVGIQIYHIPEGLSPGDWEFLAFEDFGIKPGPQKSVRQLGIKIRNTGEINRDANLRLELTNMATGEEIPLPSVPVALLPKAEQWVQLNLPADLEGKFMIIAILDSGLQYDLKIAQKEITY